MEKCKFCQCRFRRGEMQETSSGDWYCRNTKKCKQRRNN